MKKKNAIWPLLALLILLLAAGVWICVYGATEYKPLPTRWGTDTKAEAPFSGLRADLQ